MLLKITMAISLHPVLHSRADTLGLPRKAIFVAERSIIVTGSKGGVGTTTVALNLAVHLAQLSKKRVGLIEFARPFGQISLMLDFDPRFTLLDALERIDRLDAPLLASLVTRHKTGVEILAGPLHAACAPNSGNS